VFDERFDLLDQVTDASERASPNRTLRDDVEPDLDLIEPRRIRWREMDVKARVGCEPSSNAGVLVGRVVVDNEMNVQLLRDRRVDVAQELEELLVSMTLLALGQHATRGDVEGGE
jgi:hypothetical protein